MYTDCRIYPVVRLDLVSSYSQAMYFQHLIHTALPFNFPDHKNNFKLIVLFQLTPCYCHK
jgi:hypothetical protein